MRNRFTLFGERSLTLIGAVFPDSGSARAAEHALERDAALNGEVAVIGPDDPLTALKLEPETHGIWKTAIRSHAVLGLVGLALGLLAALLLQATGWPAAVSSFGYLLLFLGVMGAFAGMLIAGMITLRPDHGIVIRQLREALARRHWALVVRPRSEDHALRAMERLQALGASPLRSL